MADESLTFDEQILEAAKAIALATSALIKWATATQRELVAQGRVGCNDCLARFAYTTLHSPCAVEICFSKVL